MVLSNKKLKQKLRAEFVKASLSKDTDSTNTTNVETPNSNSLKQLIDFVTQKPRLSKRDKRREILSSTHSNDNISKGKKRKRDKKGDENGEKLDGNVVKDQNNVVENGGGDMELSLKEGKAAMKKKKAKKNKKKKKKKSKSDKQENQAELPNEVLPQQIVAETSECNKDDCKKVYVGGMPYSSTEDDIWNYFDYCGTITDIDCMKFPESGKFRGIAIISFKTEEAAKKALALDGSDMDGLYLKIQPYKTTRTVKLPDFSPRIIEGYNRVYAGNLSWDITENDLRMLFSDCNISSIRFGEDKETGEFKGYAHVDFSDKSSLTKALQLDQKLVCGRPVKISCAVPRKGAPMNVISTPTPPAAQPTPPAAQPTPPAVQPQENDSGVASGKIRRRTCYECGEKGHLSSACPKKQATEQANPNAS
ncbi:unnamed protein product [Amaranthus hypochondriacus]